MRYETISQHIESLHLAPPTSSQNVYKDECAYTFDSPFSSQGIDVCLQCFQGSSPDPRHNYTELHAKKTGHPIYLNIRKVLRTRERDQSPPKIQKLVVRDYSDEDYYDTITSVKDLDFPGQEVDLSVSNLKKVVDGVLNSISASQKQEALEWRPEVNICPHTLDLRQDPAIKVEMGNCSQCELKENLWLCLECGALNCGRNQLGGAPGNSHGIAHHDATGHPVAVKLGSITPDGTADVYCYVCDDEVKDHHLAAHMAHFGINIAEAEKTEKSLTELQLEQNVKWDFSLHSENGEQLVPVFGTGLTGLKNLGNSCYIASVLQCLFSLEPFKSAYYKPDELQEVIDNPEGNLRTQLIKIADGLLSGRYSVPDKSTVNRPKFAGEEDSKDEDEHPHQRGLPPAIFKKLIGAGHEEFSTMRQQDAFEFLMYLLSKIQEYNKKNNMPVDPTEVFNFKTEQRLECTSCKKVRYNSTLQESLSLQVPVREIESLDTEMEDSDGSNKQKVDEDTKYESVDITELFENLTTSEEVEYVCKACKNKTSIKKTGFETFPDALIVNAQRFKIINWVPTKLDIAVSVEGDELDLSKYIASRTPGEDIAIDEDEEGGEKRQSEKFVASPEATEFLLGMGYPEVRVEKALYYNNNQLEPSIEWILSHMDDADIDVPLDLSGGSKKKEPLVNPAQVDEICGMGFSPNLVRKALRLNSGSNEAAVEWIFSNMDDPGETEEEQAALQESEADSSDNKEVYAGDNSLPAKYKLKAIVCHKGRSVHAGHYVAFIKKEVSQQGPEKPGLEGERWVLFNDEKVVVSGEVEEMKKYAYIYLFVRDRTA